MARTGTPQWTVGEEIAGRYRVLGVHGQGGMGVVHRVRHMLWDVDLAVKSPRDHLDLRRFTQEAQTWVSLGLHPHVCTCHYVRVLDGVPRIFAEYLAGGSLREWIDDRRLYAGGHDEALPRVLDIAIQIAWGLQHAHEHGLVHQDVKPANVLLTTDGTAKVTDFGLARARTPVDAEQRSVSVPTQGLTPAYASPEQSAGQPLGRRTDTWSFAVTVLEMFTGGVSWLAGPVAGAALAHYRHAGPPEPHLPAMPGAIAELLRRCLRDDPGERPGAMTDIATALIEIFEGIRRYNRPAPRTIDLRADGLTNRALSLLDLDRPQEAERALVAALAADPRHPYAVYNSALLRWRRAELTDVEAIAQLTDARAAAVDPAQLDPLLARLQQERHAEQPGLDGVRELPQHGAAHSSALRDGRHALLVTRTPDADADRVLLWDLDSARAVRTFDCARGDWPCADITPNLRVAVAGGGLRRLLVWDERGERPSLTHDGDDAWGDKVSAVRVSADGRRAVTGNRRGTIRVWDLDTGTEVHVLTGGHTYAVIDVNLSPDGRWLLSRGEEDVTLWDLDAGAHERKGDFAQGSAISADGSMAGFLDNAGHLTYWPLGDGAEGTARTLTTQCRGAGKMAFSDDGRHIASVTSTGLVQIWSVDTGRCLRTCPEHGEQAPWTVRFSADGRQVFAASRRVVRRWSVPSGNVAPLLLAPPRSLTDLVERDDRARTLVAEAGREFAAERLPEALELLRRARAVPGYEHAPQVLAAWRMMAGRAVHTGIRAAWEAAPLTGHTGAVDDLDVSQDPRHAVTSAGDGTLRVWDLSSGRTVAALEMRGKPTMVRFAGDRRVLYRAVDDDAMWSWDWQSDAEQVRLVSGLSTEAQRLAVSADGAHVFTIGADLRPYLLDSRDGSVLLAFPEHSESGKTPLLAADARLAADHGRRTVRLWDTTDGRSIGALRWHYRNDIRTVALSPDGRSGLLVQEDDVVRLWDTATGQLRRAMTGHSDWVRTAEFTADGRFALSASELTIRLWDLASGECLRVIDSARRLGRVRLSADGRFLLATGKEVVYRWELDWELATRPVADWDDGVLPLLKAIRNTAARTGVAPMRSVVSRRLRHAGFGWLRPDAVIAALERLAPDGPLPEIPNRPSLETLKRLDALRGGIHACDEREALAQVRDLVCVPCRKYAIEPHGPLRPHTSGEPHAYTVDTRCTECGATQPVSLVLDNPPRQP